MRTSLLGAGLAGLALVLPVAAWGVPDAATVATRIQARYDETLDLKAEFSQEMRINPGGRVLRSAGRMYFQRPGRMRWEYDGPDPQIIVADGTYLWIHQPEDKQVLRSPVAQAFQSQTPVSFLFGVARLSRDFEPELLAPADDGGLRLALRPKAQEGGALGRLTLEVDPESYDLRAAMVTDPLGNVTEVRLIDPRRNLGVDAKKFQFERPPGTDLIEAPGG